MLTPGGFRHPSLVHEVGPTETLRFSEKRATILDMDGEEVECIDLTLQKKGSIPELGHGWIAFSGWTNLTDNPVIYFRTSWTVPPEPLTKGSQTIYLFNGISPSKHSDAILQPVLQWGPSEAGGGKRWSIASWYVDKSGHAYHSPSTNVKAGDKIVGLMTLIGKTNGLFYYRCEFEGFAQSVLHTKGIAELVWLNETLEAYSIGVCSDYPNVPHSAFTDIEVRTRKSVPSLDWSPITEITDCGQDVRVVSNVNPGGEVDIYY